MKEIINKLDFITIKICSAKTLSRQATDWEKIVALEILDEEKLSNTQKELL